MPRNLQPPASSLQPGAPASSLQPGAPASSLQPSFAEVVLPIPLRQRFTYRIPDGLRDRVGEGSRVLVPFRAGARLGVVVGLTDTRPEGVKRIVKIADVVDHGAVVPAAQLKLLLWIAKYYHAPVGEAVHLALPAALAKVGDRLFGPAERDALVLDPILQALREAAQHAGRPVPADQLLSVVPGARHHHLVALEDLGQLTSSYDHAEKVKALTETLVARTSIIPQGRLGTKQRLVVDFVDAHGESAYSELRELYGVDRAVLRGLEKRGLTTSREVELLRDPFRREAVEPRQGDPTLTAAQAEAYEALTTMLETGGVALLHGVTGSGKTEVYLRVIREALARGKRALVLLPEIALTPQFVAVFRAALGDDIAVQHSGLSAGERFDQWRRILRGEVNVIIGARSAIFAPVAQLGVIVVDEEHDPSFKQDNGVRYHARDVATVLGRLTGAAVILGSATPSLETLHNAREGRYRYLRLPGRVASRPMPLTNLIDMRYQRRDEGVSPMTRFLSERLIHEVRETVRHGEQVILFLNRRGFAPAVSCSSCGQALECTSCDITLTYHRRGHVVRCHYCGASAPMPEQCPTCGSKELDFGGAGTEQVEAYIEETFSDLRVGRMDRDTTRGSRLMETLGAFRRGDIDVLVGTQMVTKGHDFHNVTLVGVLSADQSLKFPDFRAGERTFQLLTQVSGRAGRGERQGRVFLQTYDPEHFAIRAAKDHDFDAFVDEELPFRERLGYPPFGYLIAIRVSGPDADQVFQRAQDIARGLRPGPEVELLGPVRATVHRVRNTFRVQVLLKSRQRKPLHDLAARVAAWTTKADAMLRRDKIRVELDVDPLTMG